MSYMATDMETMSCMSDVPTKLHTQRRPSTPTPPTTPNATVTLAYRLCTEIQEIHHSLTLLPSLAPSPSVNALLTRLVDLCTATYGSEFVNSFWTIPDSGRICQLLRPLCATAEGELERHWAQRITSTALSSPPPHTSPQALLSAFPYHTNYLDLSRLECATLDAFLPRPSTSTTPRTFAFIGSGPLPLTSLCILDLYANARVHNVDRDADALHVSRTLCEALGYGARVGFACEDVSDTDLQEGATDWGNMDVVFLAALVGMTTHEKVAILARLAGKLRKGTLVVARSAKGLRSVLYPVLELSEDLDRAGLEVLVEVHPHTKVVNSVIVMRVK